MNTVQRLCNAVAHRTALALVVGLLGVAPLSAAPFAETISFTQPDGTSIELWGQGNEFYAIFETLDGYSVVFDPTTKTYLYARLSADGNELVSTGVPVGKGDPKNLGLAKHLRIKPEAVKRQVAERHRQWDQAMEVSTRWNELKAFRRQADLAAESGQAMAPPSFTTTGVKVGLCLLVDFDDDPATIPQAEIVNFCNGDNYTGYGNNGSVKKYFRDNSNNLLTYSNVVTVYIRIPNSLHPKSWYNDTSRDAGGQANLLIRDAIAIMKALPNYNTEILPTFSALTVDGQNRVLACNVFYAGGNGGVWSYGLWPHSWSLYNVGAQELSPGGKRVYRYQVTNIGSRLSISTFCHENGHMLCGFPDIYDYDYDSVGGAGGFCLMNSGGGNTQICAYLKRAAGWATTTELTRTSSLTAVVTAPMGTNFNHFYRYAKPGVSTEYYLVENRQRAGRDSSIPASGIAIWHIDELGDKDNQSMVPNTTHQNYEVTLVQADNQWHFQNSVNSGDAYDLYHAANTSAGYSNQLSDLTAPHAHWWDGTGSGIRFSAFSSNGPTMTFRVDPSFTNPVITLHPSNQTTVAEENISFQVAAFGFWPLSYQWQRNGVRLNGATNDVLALTNVQPDQAGNYRAVVSNPYGSTTSSVAALTVTMSLGMAADTSGLNWDTSSSAPWFAQTNVSHDGLDAAQSGGVSNSQQTIMQVTVPGPGTLSFWWQVSSETNADYLRFFVGALLMTNLSGEVDWRQENFTLTAGAKLLKWTYAKNASGSSGQDAAWVDQVTFIPIRPPSFTAQPQDRVALAGANVIFDAVLAGTPPLSYQWQFNGFNLPNATGPSLVLTNVQLSQAGRYSVVVTNAYGSTNSSAALLSVTTVAAWGGNEGTNAPVLTNVVAVAGGESHSLALRRDGSVIAWGANDYGQSDVPGGLTSVVAIAAGRDHSLALRSDGRVVGWGRDDFGQATVPATLSNVVAIAAGLDHSLALKSDGTASPWGRNDFGQATAPATLANVVGIAGGGYHSLALKGDGTVVAWGTNYFGQSSVPSAVTNIVAIASGGEHSIALKGDGTLIAWGLNNYGQTNIPSGAANIVAIAGGRYHSLALRADGKVLAWGRNNLGQTNVVPLLANATAIAAGYAHCLAVVGHGAPFLVAHPVSLKAFTSKSAILRAVTAGALPLSYRWQFNGTDLIETNRPYLLLPNVQLTNEGVYRVVASNPYGSVTSSLATVTVVLTFVDALETPEFAWDTSSLPWFGQTNLTHDGVDAAQSGAINHNQQSILQANVNGPGTLTFWWKVSSEAGADSLRFFIGALALTNISGEVDWRQETYYLSTGSKLLKWTYVKSSSGSGGQDAGWLDQVSFAEGATLPIITSLPASQTVLAGSSATLKVVALGTPPLNYQWQLEGADLTNNTRISGVTNASLTIANANLTDAGYYRVVISNPAGSTTSAPVLLAVAAVDLSPSIRSSDGCFELLMHGEPDIWFELQASTNLANWQAIATLTNIVGTLQYVDLESTNAPQRFYRAVLK